MTASVPDMCSIACCREVQQQLTALQVAQAELAAERSQLSTHQQLIAQQRQHAVQQVQEAAQAHNKLLAQLKQARTRGLLVLPYLPACSTEYTCCPRCSTIRHGADHRLKTFCF